MVFEARFPVIMDDIFIVAKVYEEKDERYEEIEYFRGKPYRDVVNIFSGQEDLVLEKVILDTNIIKNWGY